MYKLPLIYEAEINFLHLLMTKKYKASIYKKNGRCATKINIDKNGVITGLF